MWYYYFTAYRQAIIGGDFRELIKSREKDRK